MPDSNTARPEQSLEAELIRVTRGLYLEGGYEYAKSLLADSLVLLSELRHADAGGRNDIAGPAKGTDRGH